MKKSFIINIFGRVQNVGFRYYTHRKAIELGINGFVKNMPDGSVYVEAESEDERIEKFIDFCRKGPQWAQVDEINVLETTLKEYKYFTIN
ncbi:MAG: acylphosphatase [Bacteroidetes bacterium]|nr:acylphosphatase [Bacteroidota bacterium]